MTEAVFTGFGPYSTALIASAAIALASCGSFAIIGAYQRRHPEYLAFSALCLMITGLSAFNALLVTTPSLGVGALAMRGMCISAALSFPPFFMFIGHYTRRPLHRSVIWVLTAVAVGYASLNLFMPYSMLFRDLQLAPSLGLPWGEQLTQFKGPTSNWGWSFHVLTYLAFSWALVQGVAQFMRGERIPGALLSMCLLIQFAALLWGDVVVDALQRPYPYLDTFSFLPFVLLMGFSLALRLQQRTLQLEAITRQLEAEARTRRATEDRLHHMAYHDPLTGLPNRAHTQIHLAEVLRESLRGRRWGSFMQFGLDNFRTINDALGHRMGDLLLAQIGDRLHTVVPAGARIARLGSDEFAVLAMQDADSARDEHADQARRLAENIAGHLAMPFRIEGRTLGISASVGVALFPQADSDAADIMRRADIAMHRAKAAGRNAVRVFQPDMQSDADIRMELERGLRSAIRNNELSLQYQPQVALDGSLTGAEVLLRWHHPRMGSVDPSTFIPIAEDTGLIHTLGAWVITTACRQMREWDRTGVPFGDRLSVNISPWQLSHPSFIEAIEAQVRSQGMHASRLTLELTESALLHDFEQSLQTLRRLSDIGFQLALDDFGTGYASLSYLQRLPLDEIKIDRSFVHELGTGVSAPLAGFIVDVGKRMNLRVVAEGVESDAQREALMSLGCDVLQGYAICEPVYAPDFAAWTADRSPPEAAASL